MLAAISGGAAVLGFPMQAHAFRAVNIEAVNDYSIARTYDPHWPDQPYSESDAFGFQVWTTQGPGGWNVNGYQVGDTWYNNSVWTTDFYDPQATFTPADSDNVYFDHHGSVFSYYSGHGLTTDGDSLNEPWEQVCLHASECTSPPNPDDSLPAICKRSPGDTFGTCSYTQMWRQLVVGNWNAGPFRSGAVTYSQSWVKLGESNFAGWAGVGTNGGTNVALFASSGAENSARPQEVWPVFAGLHLLGTVLVHTGDTNNSPDRGACFAEQYQNPNASIADSWGYAVGCIQSGLAACGNYNQTHHYPGGVIYGGGHGENGCGGHDMMGMGATDAEAWSRLFETWNNVNFDSPAFAPGDAQGTSYWYAHWVCNYDCNTWPFTMD